MKIQIIGLPGVGKSTALASLPIQKIDWRDHQHEKEFIQIAERTAGPLLIESAPGFMIKGTKVIKLKRPISETKRQFEDRDKCKLDDNLIAWYEEFMIPCHYIAYDQEALKRLIETLTKENK